jgi:phosphotriesterase-related protein
VTSPLSRREALAVLGGGALAALPRTASAAPVFPKGAIIRTLLKDYKPEELAGGPTLFHEHMSFTPDFMPKWIATSREYAVRRNPALANNPAPQPPATPTGQKYFLEDADLMTDEMSKAKADGLACIVDGGHPDMGRRIPFLREISTRSGLPIVAGAGFYSEPFYPADVKAMSEDQIVQALIRQTEADPVGVFGEIGSWDDITDVERKVFRAVGRAQVATNLPIFTHTGIPGRSALEQLDLLEKGGARPNRIVIGHLGNLNDPKVEVHKAICKRGAFVGFDRQGGPGDRNQVPLVMALLEAGYADNLMFASDLSAANQLKRNGGGGYAKTVTVFVPKLREAGVKEDVLHGILVDNPRRFLAFVPKKKRKH